MVNQSCDIWIQIPDLGRRIIDVELVGISPERDLALLRLTPESKEIVRTHLGEIPYLSLGNSDMVRRLDEVVALGYPLGQHAWKTTKGHINGYESHLIQLSAPINPGSSGGPLIDAQGKVVGITSSGNLQAQNVGYAIPINDLKIILDDLYRVPLLRRPYLGVLYQKASQEMTEFLGNPAPGGCYVVEVVKNSPLGRVGIQLGDMIYAIDGFTVDMYGDLRTPWNEDKMTIVDYVSGLTQGNEVKLHIYRKGVSMELTAAFGLSELPAIRVVYPGYEEIDYEVVGGMVLMQLTANHIDILKDNVPGLMKYAELKEQGEPALIITHIFPSSQLYRLRTLSIGSTIKEINGEKVSTLEQLRDVLKRSVNSKFLTVRAADNVARLSENMFVVLPFDKILNEEKQLSRDYHYNITPTVKELIASRQGKADEKATA